MSTTPVREAFMILAREGVVRQDAHRGVVVFEASREHEAINETMRKASSKRAGRLVREHIRNNARHIADLLKPTESE